MWRILLSAQLLSTLWYVSGIDGGDGRGGSGEDDLEFGRFNLTPICFSVLNGDGKAIHFVHGGKLSHLSELLQVSQEPISLHLIKCHLSRPYTNTQHYIHIVYLIYLIYTLYIDKMSLVVKCLAFELYTQIDKGNAGLRGRVYWRYREVRVGRSTGVGERRRPRPNLIS